MPHTALAQTLIKNAPHARTIRGEINGQYFWIKRATPSKHTIWHKAQKLLSLCVKNPVFKVTATTGGSAALRAEAARINTLKQHGILTPDILDINNDMLILSDIGTNIPTLLQFTHSPSQQIEYIKNAAKALASLHNNGIVHSRPFLRDMTWNGSQIGFLDLEEDALTVMSFPEAQARDIWLFLCSVTRHARINNDPTQFDITLVNTIYQSYLSALNAPVPTELALITKRLLPIGNFIKRHLWHKKYIGKDVRHAIIATDIIAKT